VVHILPGIGCNFNGQIYWGALPMITNMALLELVPVVLALSVWAQLLQNKHILLRIDNSALISIINKRTSKNKQIMTLIKPCFTRYAIQHTVQIFAH
jgi:hypothetical protein